jgi:hypothetical protein
MINLYNVGTDFIWYSIMLQLIFCLVTSFIAYQAYKIYRITKKEQARFMFLAFLFVFVSYLVQAAFDTLAWIEINYTSYVLLGIHPLSVFNEQGLYFHALFFTIGLAFLMYNAFRTENKGVMWYLILSSLLVLFLSRNLLVGYFLLGALYLGFLSYHFYLNYNEKKTRNSLLVALSFAVLFTANVMLIFMQGLSVLYYGSQTLILFGYSLLLLNYMLLK